MHDTLIIHAAEITAEAARTDTDCVSWELSVDYNMLIATVSNSEGFSIDVAITAADLAGNPELIAEETLCAVMEDVRLRRKLRLGIL